MGEGMHGMPRCQSLLVPSHIGALPDAYMPKLLYWMHRTWLQQLLYMLCQVGSGANSRGFMA